MATFIILNQTILYIFLISKIKDFGVKITFRFKNTLLQLKITRVILFYEKIKWLINYINPLQFGIKAKKW